MTRTSFQAERAMLNINRILLLVDFPNTSLRVVHQAATLARHFHSEIVMLHVVPTPSHPAGVPEDGPELARWNMLAEIARAAEEKLDQSLGAELDGLAIRRVVVRGSAGETILRAAREEKADLIMMPSCGHTFYQFLLSSAAAKMSDGSECPIWTDAQTEESLREQGVIRNVLCAVDFKPHDRKTVDWAARIAAEFSARLTLGHVTAGVKRWGPGGSYADLRWKEALVSNASEHLAELQQRMGIQAEVFIGSGDVPGVLSEAAKRTEADLLVAGCYPYGGHMRTHGYAIMCAVPIPVLSV